MATATLKDDVRVVAEKEAWRLFNLFSRACQSACHQAACQGIGKQLEMLRDRIGRLCDEGHLEMAAYIGNRFLRLYHNGHYSPAEHTAKCGL